MATTTNYSWTTPDDTALVKNGAAAIRSLGTAIDSTVFTNAGNAISKTIVDAKGDIIAATGSDAVARLAIGANNTVLTADSAETTGMKWAALSTPASGLTLIKRATYSAVANTSTTFDSVFSSTYKNYVMVIENADASTANTLRFNWRVSGSTQSNAAYPYAMYLLSNAAGGGWVEQYRGSGATYAEIGRMGSGSDRKANGTYEIYGAGNASTSPWTAGFYTSAQDARAGFCWSYYESLIVADGFILTASTGTITGTVSIYGRSTT